MNRNFKYYFFVGLFSIIPMAATIWLINWILNIFVGPGQSIINNILPNFNWITPIKPYVTWLIGFILTILFVLLSGYIISSVFGRYLFSKLESIILKIPIVNTLYQTIKGITESISSTNKQAFSKVVLIEYPKEGIWTIALVTGDSKNKEGTKFYHLYLPTTPNPTSGFMLYIPVDNVIETDMTSEEAIKIIISGGSMSPDTNEINQIK
mgnify:CR=1 FL=1|tara:strand:+ start:1305 stop:1931 length:627 start_codon:yes stop_codon:yes gene_type:complete